MNLKIPKGSCDNPDCTVFETGVCLEAHPNPDECPHFHLETLSDSNEIEHSEVISESVDKPPIKDSIRKFSGGRELGTSDVLEIMRRNYVHIIGIVGFTNAGKTCFLSSLYLLACHGMLKPRYIFSGSLSLMGFEERCRHLRNWEDGHLPDQLAEHTTLTDPRKPAFMHLNLCNPISKEEKLDLLLTDLPGEWFKELVDKAEKSDRFEFLKRADGIIFVIDALLLESDNTRHQESQRSRMLLERLSNILSTDEKPPMIILVSKCDEVEEPLTQSNSVNEILMYAEKMNFNVTIVHSSAISRKPEKIKSGTGIAEAIEKIIDFDTPAVSHIDTYNTTNSSRAFARSVET